MIQDLQTIFAHLMEPADQWQTSAFPLSALRKIFSVIMKDVSLMNPNATNVAHIRSDLMLCRDPFKNLTEDHICLRCTSIWRPLHSNEAAETMAVKTPTSNMQHNQRQWHTSCSYLITHQTPPLLSSKDNSCHFLLASELNHRCSLNPSSYSDT